MLVVVNHEVVLSLAWFACMILEAWSQLLIGLAAQSSGGVAGVEFSHMLCRSLILYLV